MEKINSIAEIQFVVVLALSLIFCIATAVLVVADKLKNEPVYVKADKVCRASSMGLVANGFLSFGLMATEAAIKYKLI